MARQGNRRSNPRPLEGRRQRPDAAPQAGRRQRPDSGSRGAARSNGIGGDQVEGRQAVRELLIAGKRRVRDLYMVGDSDSNEILDEIAELAEDAGIRIKWTERPQLDRLSNSEAPQGVLAICDEIDPANFADLLKYESGKPPFLLALDGVTDPHNVGALIRTAECFGATGVVLPRHRSAHITPTVAKASAGAIEHMQFALVPGIPAAMDQCKREGVWTVALDPDGTTDVSQIAVATEPVMLVMGAEGRGLSRLAKERCDVLAHIPQFGQVASLNVSAAGAVACHAIATRRVTK